MFLKRIEIQGFKSFADRSVISFEHPITGIVGPNGCGKSNISDAIRWVLGEQSVKSLRGSSMSDVIFQGSADRRSVNMAEVTLVFDNQNHSLNSDQPEIEITRRIYRSGNEAQYLINRVQVRLKDVLDLILDTGLGRDSLSMISQGNISSFAEAKPIERRAIFEEAAGVAKYKKRKMESLSKLERTNDNIERAMDIFSELERQVSPLKRQAKKAEIYKEKKKQLEEIEIAVLVQEIKSCNDQLEECRQKLFELESEKLMYETTIQVHETANAEGKKEMVSLDIEINRLQDEMLKVINEIQILETRKVEIDEKRKYALEVGNSEEREKQLRELLNEAKFEFEDRQKRYSDIDTEIKLLSENLTKTAMSYAEYNQEYEGQSSILRRLINRKEVLESLIKQPFNSQAGVRAIIENQHSLQGVLGVVAQVLKPHKGYEEAISTALGGALYNIVTTDESAARNAIEFLKRNQSGRATFLPLRVMKAHTIRPEHEMIAKNASGYLGVAGDFVDCDECFDAIVGNLLDNVLITENLKDANGLAEMLRFQYKIVTLDGDVVHRGGSMTGGKARNSNSIMTNQKEYDEIDSKIVSQQAKVDLAFKQLNEVKKQRSNIEANLTQLHINSAQLEPVVEAKRAKYERLKNEYEQLNPQHIEEGNSFADDLIVQLNQAYSRRDEITTVIRRKREDRVKLSQDVERKEQQIRQNRKKLEESNRLEREVQIDKTRSETRLETTLNRLTSEYQMTYEFALEKSGNEPLENAKEEVIRLRHEIEALGNVNMNAPEEFEEVNERYEFMNKQIEDLKNSREKLLNAIDEMDEVMIKQFKETFDAINGELQETFMILFGGGKAKLVLEDPNDILNTGIDIDVQPPGKAVQNIRLFSGGEKSLIAICVLFSILKVRNVPLVIFDEVEAALDQANVERFAKYLTKFSNETQFLVITHRPGTMTQCDILYGVTMQKQGVSQMLKVELTDAIDMADEEKGAIA